MRISCQLDYSKFSHFDKGRNIFKEKWFQKLILSVWFPQNWIFYSSYSFLCFLENDTEEALASDDWWLCLVFVTWELSSAQTCLTTVMALSHIIPTCLSFLAFGFASLEGWMWMCTWQFCILYFCIRTKYEIFENCFANYLLSSVVGNYLVDYIYSLHVNSQGKLGLLHFNLEIL